jgi:aspartate aminotransferase
MELDGMNRRIKDVRRELAVFGASIPALSAIDRQIGIFSLLPISSTTTATLAKDHAIYLTARGRINVAGLKTGHAKRFCDALACIDQ